MSSSGYPVKVHLKFPNPWNAHYVVQGGITIKVEGTIINNEQEMVKIANPKIAPYLVFDHSDSIFKEEVEEVKELTNITQSEQVQIKSMNTSQLINYIIQKFPNQDQEKIQSYKKSELIWLINELESTSN